MIKGKGTPAAVAVAAALATVVGWATPAFAHVEVTADKTQAGATDVTVTFKAEAESTSGNAGIVSLAVTLPTGIASTDISYVSGPAGWSLTPTASGYTVAGPALPVGQEAEYVIKVRKLPADQATLPFKTLQTYSDGQIDRWIDIQQPGQPEVEHPAPTLEIQGAVLATSAAPTPTPVPETSTPSPTATGSSTAAETGSSVGWWLLGGFLLLAAIVGVSLWLRRRGTGDGTGTGTA